MPLILGANSATGGYTVKDSLRFNSGSSDYLTRTPASASNQKTWTWSGWIKRGVLTSNQYFFLARTANNTSNGTILTGIDFTSSDNLEVYSYTYGTGITVDLITTAVYRDPSAWYHVVVAVDTTQATSSNTVKIYVNGVQVTSFGTSTYPSQNSNLAINYNCQHTLGEYISSSGSGSLYFDGYMSEVNFIDGQQLTPSSFGQTDPSTPSSGIWIPKAYTGTYGTNGFYLKFLNSASLGTDSSGNGNNFTSNGGIAATSQSTDTPTNNFATLNLLNNLSTSGSGTLAYGNLQCSYSGGLYNTFSTMALNTGKWFWETKGVSNMQQGTVGARIGFMVQNNTGYTNQYFDGSCIFGMFWHPTNGIYTNVGATTTLRSSTFTYTNGDIIGIALDLNNNISYWYKNGTLTFTYDFSALSTIGAYNISPDLGNGSGSANPVFQCNFGSPMYSANGYTDGAGYGNFSYAVPSGYYALCSANLAKYG